MKEEKLKRGETREKVIKQFTRGLYRDKLIESTEYELKQSGEYGNAWNTLKSSLGVVKQICVTDIETNCNKSDDKVVLAWLGEHIYTIQNDSLIKAVECNMFDFSSPITENNIPDNIVVELDVNDSDTYKKIFDTK